MIRRIILLGLVCLSLAGSTGCGLVGCVLCSGGACDAQCGVASGPVCGEPCGPVCGPACGPTCGPPAAAACEPECGGVPAGACEVPCGPACATCGPLTWVFNLFNASCWSTAECEIWDGGCGGCFGGGGCGEIYCGDCCEPGCDPCDQWGNYIGGGVGGYYGGYGIATVPQDVRLGSKPEVIQASPTTRQ